MTITKESLNEIVAERAPKYGPVKTSHQTVGLIWSALIENHYKCKLQHPIPGYMVALMMAALKINRASVKDGFQEDNYLDAMNYLQFAMDMQGEKDESI